MLGKERETPRDVVGQMEQFLYALNLLDCSTSAFVVHLQAFLMLPAYRDDVAIRVLGLGTSMKRMEPEFFALV